MSMRKKSLASDIQFFLRGTKPRGMRISSGSCRSLVSNVVSRTALLFVFASGIGFSIQAAVIKVLSDEGISTTFRLILYRSVIQIFISTVFLIYNERPASTDRYYSQCMSRIFGQNRYVRWILFLRCFIGFFAASCFYFSVNFMPLGDASVLAMLNPIVASVMGYIILGEVWKLPEVVATFLSLLGCIFIIRPRFIFQYIYSSEYNVGAYSSDGSGDYTEHNKLSYLGALLALLAALFAGVSFVFIRMLGTTAKTSWYNITFANAIVQLILCIPAGYLLREDVLSIGIAGTATTSSRQYILIVFGALIGAPSQILMTIGMQREKSAPATVVRMSDVLFAYVWQQLFTHNQINILSIIGALLVSGSVIVVVFFKESDQPPSSTHQVAIQHVSSNDCFTENDDNYAEEEENNDAIDVTKMDSNTIFSDAGSNPYSAITNNSAEKYDKIIKDDNTQFIPQRNDGNTNTVVTLTRTATIATMNEMVVLIHKDDRSTSCKQKYSKLSTSYLNEPIGDI